MEKLEGVPKEKIKYNVESNIKWIMSHILRYPIISLVFIMAVFFSIYYQNSASIYMGKIFDAISLNTKSEVIKLIILLFIVSIGQGLLDLASSYGILTLRLKVERDMRQEIYENLLSKDQSFHDSVSTGDVMALATNEIRNISIMFQPGILITFKSLLSYIVPICFILANFSYKLIMGPILFTITSLILLGSYSKNINAITKDVRKNFGKLNSDLNEVIEGIEVVKSSAQEEKEVRNFEKNTQAILNNSLKRVKLEAGYKPTLIFALFFGIALYQSFSMFIDGQLILGQLISYITIYLNLKYPISNAEISFSFIGQGMASAGRIVDTLRNSKDVKKKDYEVNKPVEGKIEFKNVSFGYVEDTKVLKNLNFSIKSGEVVAIVGGTGSGKSTIAKLINRTYDVDEGEILIDGENIKNWNIDALRSDIGIIEQDIFLFSWSILKNITFGSRDISKICSMESIRDCAEKAYAHNFIMDFPDNYETLVGERGIQLSGGQRQRIAIARTLLLNPKILVLDDSTSAVDSKTEDEIQKGISNIMKERTTILITHRLSQIRWADKILMMKNETIIAQGNHEELMKICKEYREMYSEYL